MIIRKNNVVSRTGDTMTGPLQINSTLGVTLTLTASGSIHFSTGLVSDDSSSVSGVFGYYGELLSLSRTTATVSMTGAGSVIQATGAGTMKITSAASQNIEILPGAGVGIGQASPTAILHLKAGTATASTAPLKFTSGTNLTTAEAGAMEFDGTNFYLSPSTTRKRIPLTDNATPSNGQIPIGNGTDYTVAVITGTSNQITVTNASGSITLSTPQNIHTAATPTFATVTHSTSAILSSVAAPGSPSEGELWNDSTQKAVTGYINSLNQKLSGVFFTQTATVTVQNSVVATTLIGTGVGTDTLPADFLTIGKTIRVTARGYYSTTGTPNLRFRVLFGATVLGTTGNQATPSGASNLFWEVSSIITCRTTGATGTTQSQGYANVNTSATAGQRWDMVETATDTVDTTATQQLIVEVLWGTASASNSIKCTNVIMEALN